MLEMMLAGKKKGRSMLIVDSNNDLHLVNLRTREIEWTVTVFSGMSTLDVAMADDGYIAMAGTNRDFYIAEPDGAGGRWLDLPTGVDTRQVLPWGPGEVILADAHGLRAIHLASGATRRIEHSFGYIISPKIFQVSDGLIYVADSSSPVRIARLGYDEVFSQTITQDIASKIAGAVETPDGLRFLDTNDYVRDELGNALFRASQYYGSVTPRYGDAVSVLDHAILSLDTGKGAALARLDEPALSNRRNNSNTSAVTADSDGNLYIGYSSSGSDITCTDITFNVLWSEKVLPGTSTRKLVILE